MSDSIHETEERRILDMVATGQISAEEGDALLQALGRSSTATLRCPWCAEHIPGGTATCPECQESLAPRTPPPQGMHPTDGLSTLDKILAIATLLICGIYIIQHIPPHAFLASALAFLGLASGILIFKQHPLGWTLGIAWSAIQILELVINGHAINQQIFHFGLRFNINGLGVNLLAILFLVFFTKANTQREAHIT